MVPADARLAPENAPVVKLAGPASGTVKSLGKVIPVSSELRLRPAKVPVKVPPAVTKSNVLSADAVRGRANKAIKTIRFMTTSKTHVEKRRPSRDLSCFRAPLIGVKHPIMVRKYARRDIG